jgi:hypothetical protein
MSLVYAIGFIPSHLIHQKNSTAAITARPRTIGTKSDFFIVKLKAKKTTGKNIFAFCVIFF